MPSLTDALCTMCGLCCDGSLFADVELAGDDESAGLEALGLDVEEADREHRGLLLQPCRALHGTRCTIYAQRPSCCRTFECRLLQRARRGEVSVAHAKQKIAMARGQIVHVEQLIASLGPRAGERLPLKERCAEALARSEQSDRSERSGRLRAQLESSMAALERHLDETFLGG